MDDYIYKKAYHLSKSNPYLPIHVLYNGDYRVEFMDAAEMGVDGFVNVAEFLDGKLIWESKDF